MDERYPEAMKLAKLANDAAESARTIWVGFLAFMTFLALAAFGTSHVNLFLRSPLALPPPISITIDLVGFYVVAPLLLLALHVYILTKLTLLAHVHSDFETQLAQDVQYSSVRKQARKHLNTTLFLRALSTWKDEVGHRDLSFWLITALLVTSLAIAPVATLLFTWIRFLPYQSEVVTMLHRAVFALDIVALVIAFKVVMKTPTSNLKQLSVYGSTAMFVSLFWVVFTFPRECWQENERLCWDNNSLLKLVGITRTIGFIKTIEGGETRITAGIETTSLEWPPTSLQLAHKEFLDDLKTSDLSKVRFTHTFRGRSLVGVDLTDSDLRKVAFVQADIRAANFTRARLNEADLSGAKLQGVDLSYAKLLGARLIGTGLQGADLSYARMQGAVLVGVELQGAHLYRTRMQGANLARAQLQGATLLDAEMQAVNLSHAQMQGTSIKHSKLQGAKLARAQMSGAQLSNTQMQGTDLSNAQMRGTLIRGAFVWRSNPRGIVGDPLVTGLIVQPLDDAEKSVDEWLANIPTGTRRAAAKDRLAILARSATVEDDAIANVWAEHKHRSGDETLHEAAMVRHREAFGEAILANACVNRKGAAQAADGMLRGVLVFAIQPHTREIRSKVERCRSE
ncbi:MAG: pentapeptide repeat-containing protein [Pirellulales bacterium]|nr:pentapeptide repeat-containing protein [Pirellulales bacterium]